MHLKCQSVLNHDIFQLMYILIQQQQSYGCYSTGAALLQVTLSQLRLASLYQTMLLKCSKGTYIIILMVLMVCWNKDGDASVLNFSTSLVSNNCFVTFGFTNFCDIDV